jgi:hypothetical protein
LRTTDCFSPRFAGLVSVSNGWDDVQRLNHA